MAGYTKVNFADVEDEGKDGNEMRFARKYLDSRDLGVTLRRYKPNYRNPGAHKHETQEEAYIVIEGSGTALLDDKTEELKQWDVLRVAPETSRTFESGPDGMGLIIVGGPKPPDGDGVKTDANWPK